MNMNEITTRLMNNAGIRTLQLDNVDAVNPGSGTFQELYNDYKASKIKLLTRGGEIVGISYDAGARNIEEDNIALLQFQRKYSGKPLRAYIMKIIDITISGRTIENIDEDSCSVEITYEDGEVETLGKRRKVTESHKDGTSEKICERERPCSCSDMDESEDYEDELPESVEIDADELGYSQCTDDYIYEDHALDKYVRDYLRDVYGHYLARGCELDISVADNIVYVDGIEWGRKR